MPLQRSTLAGLAAGLVLAAASPAAADALTIPKGTVVDLRLEGALSTRTAKVGDTFRARVAQPLYVDGLLALPPGTMVEGKVEIVESPARGARSGVLGIEFGRLHLPGGKDEGIDAELTSLRQDDRRRVVELAPKVSTGRKIDVVIIGNTRVEDGRAHTLVGLGGGDNDALARDWAHSSLSDSEVEVAAGTAITMEFDEPLGLSSSTLQAAAEKGDEPRRLLTSARAVKAAQDALRTRKLYQGATDGLLGLETRVALIRLQLDNGQMPTGDLDEGTARLLGVTP